MRQRTYFAAPLLLAVMALCAMISGALAYEPIRSTKGGVIKWNRFPVPYQFSINGDTGIFAPITVQAAFESFRQSARNWEQLQTSDVSLIEAPGSPDLTASRGVGLDGFNVITFASSDFLPLPFGVVGVTFVFVQDFDSPLGTTTEIIDADILFNDLDFAFVTNQPTIPGTGQINFAEVAIHELGHFLGLGHTFVRSPVTAPMPNDLDPMLMPGFDDINDVIVQDVPVMFPYVGFTERVASFVQPDDEAGLGALYPDRQNRFRGNFGVVSGEVRDLLTETPIFGAQVVLLGVADAVLNVTAALSNPVVAAITLPDGSYRIEGVPPGQYLALAQNITPENLGQFHNNQQQPVDVDIPPTFHLHARSLERARVFTVVAGQTLDDIDIGVLLGLSVDEESEPNNRPSDANEYFIDGPSRLGVIDPAGDIDAFRFHASAGELLRIEVFADRIHSQLQPVLRLYDIDQLRQATNFAQVTPLRQEIDTPGIAPDAAMTFRVPKSGTYFVTVTDRFGRGGPDYWYVLDITRLSRQITMHPLGPATAVLGFNVSAEDVDFSGTGQGGNKDHLVELKSVTVRFESTNGALSYNPDDPDIRDMFLPPTMDAKSGVALYDNSGSGRDRFDVAPGDPRNSDELVPLTGVPRVIQRGPNRFDVVFDIAPDVMVPHERNIHPDYWIVVKTSLDLFQGDNFQVTIPPGGIVVENLTLFNRQAAVYDETFPVYPNTFYGDIVELINLTSAEQRIDANSPPTAVIGLNVIGAPSQDYFISEVALTIVGFNGKALRRNPFAQLINPVLAANPTFFNVPESAPLEKLDRNDFLPLQVNGLGGFGVYRDVSDPVGRDGLFDPRIDIAIPLAKAHEPSGRLGPRFETLESFEIPEGYIRQLLPHFADRVITSDLLDRLGITAFKVILPLEASGETTGLLQVPSTDEAAKQTLGPDFFVVVKTSPLMRALDTFVPIILPGDIKVQAGLRQDPANRPLPVPVNDGIHPLRAGGTRQLVARPEPVFIINDLVSTAGAILSTTAEGSAPLPVLGINANDRGQNAFNFFLNTIGPATLDAMRYFNASPVFDAILLSLIPDEDTQVVPPGTLAPFNAVFDWDSRNLPANGIWFVVDNNTPIGDGVDNDGDGLVDEETWNLQDDDLDGRIDEDLGDRIGTMAPFGGIGHFDELDKYWPYPTYQLQNPNVVTPFLGDSMFYPSAANPLVIGSNPVTGELSYRIPMEARQTNETGPHMVPDFFFNTHGTPGLPPLEKPITTLDMDPHTPRIPGLPMFSLFEMFVRTTNRPIYYVNEAPVVTGVAPWAYQPGSLTQSYMHGVYISTGVIPEVAAFPASISYNYKLEIPDDDIGPLAGDNFFIALRSGNNAHLGDTFRVVLQSIDHSTYQDIQPSLALADPRSSTFEFVSGPIRVGRGTFPPTFRFIAPSRESSNRVDGRNRYVVRWEAHDPDSTAWISLYLDSDNRGFDGILLKENLNADFDSSLVLDFNYLIPQLRLDPRKNYWVYAIVDDGINPPVSVYSERPITLRQDLRTSFGYIKLRDNGQVHVLYSYDELGVGGDESRDRFRQFPAPITGMASDLETTFGSDGILILNKNGTVMGFGEIRLYFPHGRVWTADNRIDGYLLHGVDASHYALGDVAIDLEVDWNRGAYYILSRDFGIVSAFWATDPDSVPKSAQPPLVQALRNANLSSAYPFVDMELTPDGDGLYLLDASGRVHALGTASPALANAVTTIGGPRVVDLAITPDGGGLAMLYANGDLRIAGSAPSLTQAERLTFSRFLTEEGDEAQTVKVILGDNGMTGYIAMSRSGRVAVAPENLVLLPIDDIQATNAMRDLEPSIISNLTTIGSAVFELYKQIRRENLNGVMALTSPEYKDDHGNDYNMFRNSLRNFFNSYEIDAWNVSSLLEAWDPTSVPENFVGFATEAERHPIEITIIGQRVITNVQTSFLVRLPELYLLNLPTDSQGVETYTYPFEFDDLDPTGFTYTQVNEIREVGDGRGWLFEIYDIAEIGGLDLGLPLGLDGLTPGDQEFRFLTRRNERIFEAAFDKGVDGPWNIKFKANGPQQLDTYMLVFRTRGVAGLAFSPPEMEFLTYGQNAAFTNFPATIDATHEFQWENGALKLINFDLLFIQDGPQDIPLGKLAPGEQAVVESPLGFNIRERGMARNRYLAHDKKNDDYVSFRLQGGQMLVDCIGGGVASLTELLGITEFNMDRTPDDMKMTQDDWHELADFIVTRLTDKGAFGVGFPPFEADLGEAIPGDIFIVLDCNSTDFALIRVVAYNDADELLLFDWYARPEFRFPEPLSYR